MMKLSKAVIDSAPKVELHMHLEGSLEPKLLFALAQRNNVDCGYESLEALQKAYNFSNLQSFLDVYYAGANVLLHEQDFYDLTWAYVLKCHAQNVRHIEPFFDPQTHLERGVSFETIINGIDRALIDAQSQFGMSSMLIMCFLRHLDQESAFTTLELAKSHLSKISGVGLDSSELGNPPEKFSEVFEKSRELGLKLVAHAGEEGPASYIWSAINDLQVQRIDHGVRAIEDEQLMRHLAQIRMPLTVCPLSNTKLKVFEHMSQHNIFQLLDKGLCVTVNSDDPAYFGGYMNENFHALYQDLAMSASQFKQLLSNSVEASFASQARKLQLQTEIESALVDA
ncbi:adenosine deaminase [Alginatibacterium sediminis]|uniref:Adenine deaminase n=1 Tax=Alginatibacterium sediminis TaxID=2164068 RepID=A0A420EGA8_9ALTE|nr:adenosine deaminase [Alginatibacterium sediminis]RKF19703.1 adenosine deaminase [Alginatibacterium sediminis]